MSLSRAIGAAFIIGGLTFASAAAATAARSPDAFLDGMQGRWNVAGTFNGHPAKHKFKAEWGFQYGYLRFRDVSEEEKADGTEEFEVIAYLGYDAAKAQYVCVWLDNSGTVDPEAAAAAAPRVGDKLEFVFKTPQGPVHRSFAYDSKTKTWTMNIDAEKDGVLQPVARLTLKQH